jgi:hypothetical protein
LRLYHLLVFLVLLLLLLLVVLLVLLLQLTPPALSEPRAASTPQRCRPRAEPSQPVVRNEGE